MTFITLVWIVVQFLFYIYIVTERLILEIDRVSESNQQSNRKRNGKQAPENRRFKPP